MNKDKPLLLLVLSAALAAADFNSSAQTAAVTVSGASGPWHISLNPDYSYVENGLPPTVVDNSFGLAFAAGDMLLVSSLTPGQATLLAGAGGSLWTDANGDQAGTAYGAGSRSPGQYIPTTVYLAELVGTFANNGVIVGTPFAIGNGPRTLTIPTGANELLMGVVDNNYGDNGGSVGVSVTELFTIGNVLVFTNSADTNWYNPTNWSPNQVPGAQDTAVITALPVAITDSATVGALDLEGGTLSAPYGLTIVSGGNWTGGVLNGQVTVAKTATFHLNNPGGNLDLPGTALSIYGTVIWEGGTIRGDGTTVVNNNGIWIVNGVNDQINNAYGGTPEFINSGSFVVQNAAAQTVTFSGVEFTNSFDADNAVDARGGTLLLEGGGYLNGGFQAEAGAAIRFDQVAGSDAAFTTGPNFRCTGPGSVRLTDGVMTLGYDQAGLALEGGMVTLGPNFQDKGAITNLTLDGSDLLGTNTLEGTMNWLDGNLFGVFTISSSGALNLSGAGDVTQYAALTNAGHINWNGSGDWCLYNDRAENHGLIVNLPGGVIDAQCNDEMCYDYGYEWFSNAGLFRKTMSTNRTIVDVVFTNTGTVAVESGELDFDNANGSYGGVFQAANGTTLKFNSGGVLSGSFTAGFGADIGFDSGTFSEVPAAVFGGAGKVEMNGGTLTLQSDVIPNLQLNGGALNLPAGFQGGTITNLTVTGITLNGTNTVTGLLNLNGSASGPLVVASGGVVNWGGGTLSGGLTVAPGGVVNITGQSYSYMYVAGISNAGTINWTGGYPALIYGSTFYNLAGGVFNIECDGYFYYYYGSEKFNNAGLVQKFGTTGRTTIEVNLTNTGVVLAQSGTLVFSDYYNGWNEDLGGTFQADAGATLEFDAGGILTGNFTSAAGGHILLASGTFTPGPTLVFNGPGANALTGGTITLTNDIITNLQLTGGVVLLTPEFQGGAITNLALNGASLEGSNTVTGILNLNGSVEGPLTVATNATLNFNGSIFSPLTLLPGATMNWSGGYMYMPLTVPTNAVVNLAGTIYVEAPLTNAGTVNWNGGTLDLWAYSYYYYYYYGVINIYNLAGATFNIQGNVYGSDSGIFNNAGLFRKWLNPGTSTLNWVFHNTGLVDIQTGTLAMNGTIQNTNIFGTYEAEAGATLNFGGGGYLNGEFTAAGGGTIDFSGGTFVNTTSTVLDGVGAHNLNGGTMNLLYDFPANLQLVSGNINPGPFFQGGSIVNLTLNGLGLAGANTVTGVLNLHGDVDGALTVAGNATVSVSGTINSPITLQSGATLNWTGQSIYAPVTVQAGAVWNLAPANSAFLEAPVMNSGTINWTGGYLELYNYYYYFYYYDNYYSPVGIYNFGGATFNVLTDQPIYQYYGGFIENDGAFRKSGTSGANNIQALFTNTDTIDVESGALQFHNTFSQTGGTWDIGINGAGNNGALAFSGVAPLPSTLTVTANNGYVPSLNDSFAIATYSSFTGNISETNLPADGAAWQLNCGTGALSLAATNLAVPTISITSPANNDIFSAPASITLSAAVADTNAAITSVQFFVGTNLLGAGQFQAASQLYSYAWNSPAPGVYTIGALASDAHGGLAAAAPVNITVYSSGLHAVTYTWTNAAATDWFTAGNWTPNGVPGALDNVILNTGSPVLLSHNTSANNVLLSGGTLGGNGTLTVTNTFTWTGGAVTNTLAISSNATLLIHSVNGVSLINATLVNLGTVQWNLGAIAGGPKTIITNDSSGLWLLQTDNTLRLGNTTALTNGLFVNNGTVRKTTTTGTTYFNSENFVNNGTVDAQSGTIAFGSGGILGGAYNTAAGATIQFNGGAFTLDSLPSFTGPGADLFSGGTLTMLRDVSPQLQLTGGSVTLGANFQNKGSITNLTLSGATLVGTNTVSGTFNFFSGVAGNGALTVATNGLLVLGMTNNYAYITLQNLSLVNAGEILWQGGYLYCYGSAIANNNLWLMQFGNSEGGSEMYGGTNVNNGLIKQTSGGYSYLYNQVFINNGTVDAEVGTIELGSGGAFAGAYYADAGATIAFTGGTNTLNTLAGLPNFTGLGSFQFGGGTLIMSNDIDPALQLTGGTVVLGPAFQNGGAINNLVINGSTLAGTNTVAGSLTFVGGSITGPLTVNSNGTLTFMPGTLGVYGNGAITNFGSVFCVSNMEYFDCQISSALFVNNGLWLDQGASYFYDYGAAAFVNNGIYRKEGSTGTTYFNIRVNNNGLFDVRTGAVELEDGGVLGGAFNVAAQADLYMNSGNFTGGVPPPNFTGAGLVEFSASLTLTNDVIPSLPLTGGTVLLGPNFQRNGAITNLTLNGATLGGTNFVSGALTLSSGSQVTGTLTVLTNSLLTISGSDSVTFGAGATLINNGVVDWTGGEIYTYPGTVITNSGLWLVETDNEIYNEYYNYYYYYNYYPNTRFLNQGTFAKTTTAGTTSFYGIAFLNSGTLDIQSGTVNFAAANYDTNSAAYAQTGATLAFGVSAPNLAGQLVLSTNVSLDGTLEVDVLNGYTPSLGDEIPVITYGTASKTAFANLILPPLTGMTWDVETGSSGVQLRVVPSVATTSRSQISGSVLDGNGNSIAGVTVYATQTGVTNLIENGSFETPAVPSQWSFYPGGSTNSIPGWTVIGPANRNIALHLYNAYGPAEDGAQYFDATGNTGGGGITQAFPTVPGTTYELVFYHGTYSRYGYNAVLGVAIDTNYYTFGETDGTYGNLDWRRVALLFTASSNQTSLTFTDLNGFDANNAFVDNVQVIPPGLGTVAQATTGADGSYQIPVPNGTFQVGVDGLPNAGYNNVDDQQVLVNSDHENPIASFTTSPLSGGQFFTIATSVNPPALGTASGGGPGFLMGAPVTVSVAQNASVLPYFFSGWTENGVLESTNVNYSFTAYRNRSLVANFALPGLLLAASNNPSGDGGVSGAGIYTYNTTNVFTAFPLPGYKFLYWTTNGVLVSANNPLSLLVLTNLVLVANYGDANPSHVVTITSSPPGLITGTGAGTYTNGQTAIISAPAAVTNAVTNFYVFQGFTLKGSPVTSASSFSKSFSTFDLASLNYVAVYQLFPVQPQIIGVRDNYANPVPATTGFLVTFQFDRSMRTNPPPLVVLPNSNPNAVQATVGVNGLWTTTSVSNDTYQTPGITFGNGMDGNVKVLISRVQDIYGHALSPTNVLNLVVHSTPPPPPVVTLASPANGALLTNNAGFVIRGTVTSTNFSGGVVNLYANGAPWGTGVLGTPLTSSNTPYTFTVNSGLALGSYSLQAVAIDASQLTATSAVVHLTMQSPGSTLIDFEALDASSGPVGANLLSNYLARFGVTATNVTANTSMVVADDQVFLGGNVVTASSGDNFLAQTGANGAVSYTLLFSQPYASVSWVRPGLPAGTTGASLPGWRAHIFDNQGNELGSAGENALGTFTNVPAARFTLLGRSATQSLATNIASIRFDGNNQGVSALSTLPLDDLLLSTAAVNTTLAVSLTNGAGTALTAPGTVVLAAAVSDSGGTVSQVSFYEGSNFVSAAALSGGAASLTLNNLAAGTYVFTAVASDSIGAVRSSSPLTNTVAVKLGLNVINFDVLDTSAGSVGGTALSNYLSASFGVTLSNVTVGTAMEAVNGGLVAGNGGAVASSPPNYFTQAGLNQPVSFTLVFRSPLQAFEFTRVALLAGAGGVSHPQWTATVFDANGTQLGSAGENLITSATNVPARSFVLTGLNTDWISSARFDSDSQQTAAFSAVLLDDLVLNATNATAIAAPLSAVLTGLPVSGTAAAPATFTLSAYVTDSLGTNYSVSFYAGPNLLGSASASPYNFVWSNVLAGAYVLRAQVADSSGVTAYSSPVAITVAGKSGNSQVVNFDSLTLNATKVPVSGQVLSNYLYTNGIVLTTNVTPGTALAVENQATINGGGAVAASSPPNILTQIGTSGPVSYTLNFLTPLTNFGFTRPELLANPFVSHPAWQATAFDAAGVALTNVGEGLIGSYTNVGAQAFTLSGPGIASVQFASQGSGLTTVNAMVADDFVLTTNAAGVNFPPAVAITSPPAGLQVISPAALTMTAQAVDPAGIASVSFYANGALIGSAASSPYSVQWTNAAGPNLGVGGYALTAVAVDNNSPSLSRTSPVVNVTILPTAFLFAIVNQPASQTVNLGSSVTFSVATTGTGSVTYQWYQNGTMLTGQTDSTLTLCPVNNGDAGSYTVTATSGGVTLTSAPPAVLTLAQPPVITTQPLSQTNVTGANVVLSVTASGVGPFSYQWLRNGANLAGATNSTYSILAAQPLNSGSYQVVVANPVAFVVSAPAAVVVQSGNSSAQTVNNDNFTNRIRINPLLGPVLGNNQNATSEPGEPLHDGKPGGKSIWYTWTASFTGVISLGTQGSDFDTLLAVYTGTNLSKLTPVAADDDSGGFLTSLVTFNVKAGTPYQIAVDGFNGASGNVVLGMPSGTAYRVLTPSTGNSVPLITNQPASQLVLAGATVTLRVGASNALTYQWFFQGAPVEVGGTRSSLVITNFRAGSVGLYKVLVANAAGSVESEQASLQIGAANQPGWGGLAQLKFGDTVDLAGALPNQSPGPSLGGGDTRGYSVSQVFSTVGASKEPSEPDHGGQAGGASEWSVYTTPASGTLVVSTAGSSYNTILAVYSGATTNLAGLVPLASGFVTNYLVQGQPTVVLPGVAAKTRFYIAVDGYKGASGTVQLSIGLGQKPTVTPPVSQWVAPGSNATFTVTAVGTTNFGYQWKFNGVNIPKATSSSYTVANASTTNVGSYTVVVSNVVAVVTSTPPATLTLATNPVITAQPASQTVVIGQKAQFTVTVAGVNAKTNPLRYQWYFGNYAASTAVPKATNSTLAFPAAQYTNNGTYFVTITNSYGATNSVVVTLTVRDTNAPAVLFASPKDGFISTNNTVAVTGTASDNVAVASVQVAVGTNAPQTAVGTVKWTNVVTLVPGTNLITAQSVDEAGNPSVPSKLHIIYQVKSQLTVKTSGTGTTASTSGATNLAFLVIGQSYNIVAAPGHNYLFTNWTSGSGAGLLTNHPGGTNLTFTMSTNLVLQANFVTNPFLAVAGFYNGLFYPTAVTEASSGFITATISSNSAGTYSAKLLLNGASNSFSGSFDLTGTAQATLTNSGQRISLTLSLDFNPADALLGGSVSNTVTGWNSVIQADRAVFTASANPATNYAGQFTLLLPPDADTAPANSPDGYGYATITNTLAGISTLSGLLADGTPFSWSVPITQDGGVPLYQSLYSGKGSLLGWIYFTNEPPKTVFTNSSFSWIKPAVSKTLYPSGFTNLQTNVFGSFYTNTPGVLALGLTNATLTLSNGNLTNGTLVFTNIDIGTNSTSRYFLTNLDTGTNLGHTNLLGIQINPTNGAVTVTFRATGAKTNTVGKGAVLQNQTNAAGYFLGTNQSGSFILH